MSLCLLLAGLVPAHAQNVSVNFGLGTATDGSNGNCLDTFGEDTGPCGGGFPTPSMGGLFGVFGANFMFNPYIGVGGEYSFKWSQAPYADVNYRPNFFDFNAVF